MTHHRWIIFSLTGFLLAGCAGSKVKSPPFNQPDRTVNAAPAAPVNLIQSAQTDADLARARALPAHLPALSGVRGDGKAASLPADFVSPFKLVALALRPEGIAVVNGVREGVARLLATQPSLAAYQVIVLESGMEPFARFAQPALAAAKLDTPYPFVFGMVAYTDSGALTRALEQATPTAAHFVVLDTENRVLWQSNTFDVADEAAVANTLASILSASPPPTDKAATGAPEPKRSSSSAPSQL